jgi:hypothetical protein
MENAAFIQLLSQQSWNIQPNKNAASVNNLANERANNAPVEFRDFVKLFDMCTNKTDDTWFLSYKDYNNQTDSAFPWNEFEQQSLDIVETDQISAVKQFWESHLPILMSVKNGYQYVAIGIGKEHVNKIFYGSEPEYEEAILIANSFAEFKQHYINALNGKRQSDHYKFIV